MTGIEVIQWIQAIMGPHLQPLFLGITYLGSEYAYIVILTLYYWLIDPWSGRQLGLFLGISYGVNTILKGMFVYLRPFEVEPSLASPAAKATIEGAAFPSGHAQGSATFWLYVAWHHDRIWLWIASVLVIALVTLSRLYLGLHFPRDVGSGLILGILFAWLGTRLTLPVRQPLWIQVLVVAVTFVLAVALPGLARPLGVITGFFLTYPYITPPTTWQDRLWFGGIGLLLVVLLYGGSGWLLSSWREVGWVVYWRYCGLTLFATEVWPRLARYK